MTIGNYMTIADATKWANRRKSGFIKKIKETTLRRAIKLERLKAVKVNDARWLIRQDDLIAWGKSVKLVIVQPVPKSPPAAAPVQEKIRVRILPRPVQDFLRTTKCGWKRKEGSKSLAWKQAVAHHLLNLPKEHKGLTGDEMVAHLARDYSIGWSAVTNYMPRLEEAGFVIHDQPLWRWNHGTPAKQGSFFDNRPFPDMPTRGTA